MKKHMILAAGVALVTAAISVFAFVNNEKNSMDALFKANVEALADNEGTPVTTCFIDGISGEWVSAKFCDKETSTSMLYPCPTSEFWGHKSASSYCTK